MLLLIVFVAAGFYIYRYISAKQAKSNMESTYAALKWPTFLSQKSGDCSTFDCSYEYSTHTFINTVADGVVHALNDAGYQIDNTFGYNPFTNLAAHTINAKKSEYNFQIEMLPQSNSPDDQTVTQVKVHLFQGAF
jgi:hypothetical protein